MKKIFIYVRKNISFHENNSKKKVKLKYINVIQNLCLIRTITLQAVSSVLILQLLYIN